jgi:hypothetical protein
LTLPAGVGVPSFTLCVKMAVPSAAQPQVGSLAQYAVVTIGADQVRPASAEIHAADFTRRLGSGSSIEQARRRRESVGCAAITTSLNGDEGRVALTWTLAETVSSAPCAVAGAADWGAAPALALRQATATRTGSDSRDGAERVMRYFATFASASSSIFTSASRS